MIRNLTEASITIYDGDKPLIMFPSDVQLRDIVHAISGEVIIGEVEGIPIVELILGKVNLPEPEDETFLLVNRIVAEAAAAQGRTVSDLLLMSPSSTVRDVEGHIIGCRQLMRLPR